MTWCHYSGATFLTDGFGRARVVVPMKNKPSKSLPIVVGAKGFCSKLGAYIEPIERGRKFRLSAIRD
jgi:hypothetical protein